MAFEPPERERATAQVLATTLCVLGLATAFLGVSLVLTGRFKLGTLVAYLPIPVIGGYLAFIGLFCGQAGLGLMAHTTVHTPLDIFKLDAEQWMLMGPSSMSAPHKHVGRHTHTAAARQGYVVELGFCRP